MALIEGSDKNVSWRATPALGSWPVLRKLETLAFASMFIAVPLFALKVVNQATATLAVTNTSVDLQHDLRRAAEIARTYGLQTKVTTQAITSNVPASYSVQAGDKITEVVRMPRGVNIVGEVHFDDKGLPEKPAVFIISKGSNSVSVDVDNRGVVEMP